MSTAERGAGPSGTPPPGNPKPGTPKPGSPDPGSADSPTARARPLPSRPAVSATAPQPRPTRTVVRPARRRRSTVRKVDPWSVLKLSVIFYLCVLLVAMLALTVFWAVVTRIGALDTLYTIAADTANVQLRFDGANIARALFLIGLLNVVLVSALNVFLAFLYNLIADLVGGLRVTLELEE